MYTKDVKLSSVSFWGWGSLGEFLVYVIRQQLPERNPKDVPGFRAIRSWILFRV